MKIRLTDGEHETAKLLAKLRNINNDAVGAVATPYGDYDVDKHLPDAIGAEMAVAQALNIYPDLTVHPRSGGAELVTDGGLCLDVKQTSREDGNLLVSTEKTVDDADVYILVHGTLPDYKIMGWAYAEDVIKGMNKTDLGYGFVYLYLVQFLKVFNRASFR